MDLKNIVPFIIIVLTRNILCRPTNSKPINFQFSHHEVLSISSSDDDVQDEDFYDYPAMGDPYPDGQDSGRKLQSVKWVPSYDIYENWAEEYYNQDEEKEGNVENILHPKETLLDRLISATQNKTEEEIKLETKEAEQQREILKKTILYCSWTLGIIIVFCFAVFLMKKCWKRIACDFCDVFSYKNKIKKMMANITPGKYVHSDGRVEHYKPTEEEKEAIKDIQKILFSLA